MTVYTSSIPDANHSPAFDQPLMLANFQYLSGNGSQIGLNQDHFFTSNSANAGDLTHRKVTLTNLASAPALPAGTNGAVYTKSVSGTPQLFFYNGAETQLTSGAAPVVTPTAGAIPLPGNLVMNYGTVAFVNGGAVVYTQAYSAPAYSIQLTVKHTGSTNFSAEVDTSSNTGFVFVGSRSNAADLYYIAIGPI